MIGNALEQAILRSMLGVLTSSRKRSVDRNALVHALVEQGLVEAQSDADAAVNSLERGEFILNGDGRNIRLSGSGMVLGLGLELPPEVEKRLSALIPRLSAEAEVERGPVAHR